MAPINCISGGSQCTWWCWVLPDEGSSVGFGAGASVSMHQMVLGAP